MKSLIRKFIASFIVLSFVTSIIFPAKVDAQSVFNLPVPGTVITFSPPFIPPLVRGITLYPDNPLKFDFIVDVGDDHLQGDVFQKESMKLIKYFLVSLTVPENDMWVNLSPYEKDRIVPEHFGKTEMGRDLLLQDYILKQLTASLMNPEQKVGAEFWQKVREKAKEQFGTDDVPTDTFNKVWIVPDKAQVYVKGQSVYVVDSHLKVMLEEDYLARENAVIKKEQLTEDTKATSQMTKDLIREIILPEIEKEVNEGKNFALLRQIQNSAILAAWYKKNLKQTLLGKVYVDQKKTDGINSDDKEVAQKIYNQYLEAFKKGVYDLIKEDYDPTTQEVVPRKYFSGGVNELLSPIVTATTSTSQDFAQLSDRVASRVFLELESIDSLQSAQSDDLGTSLGGDLTFKDKLLSKARAYYAKQVSKEEARQATPRQLIELFLKDIKNAIAKGTLENNKLEILESSKVDGVLKDFESKKWPTPQSKVEVVLLSSELLGNTSFKRLILDNEDGIRGIQIKNSHGGWTVVLIKEDLISEDGQFIEYGLKILQEEILEAALREQGLDTIKAHNEAVKLLGEPQRAVNLTQDSELIGKLLAVDQDQDIGTAVNPDIRRTADNLYNKFRSLISGGQTFREIRSALMDLSNFDRKSRAKDDYVNEVYKRALNEYADALYRTMKSRDVSKVEIDDLRFFLNELDELARTTKHPNVQQVYRDAMLTFAQFIHKKMQFLIENGTRFDVLKQLLYNFENFSRTSRDENVQRVYRDALFTYADCVHNTLKASIKKGGTSFDKLKWLLDDLKELVRTTKDEKVKQVYSDALVTYANSVHGTMKALIAEGTTFDRLKGLLDDLKWLSTDTSDVNVKKIYEDARVTYANVLHETMKARAKKGATSTSLKSLLDDLKWFANDTKDENVKQIYKAALMTYAQFLHNWMKLLLSKGTTFRDLKGLLDDLKWFSMDVKDDNVKQVYTEAIRTYVDALYNTMINNIGAKKRPYDIKWLLNEIEDLFRDTKDPYASTVFQNAKGQFEQYEATFQQREYARQDYRDSQRGGERQGSSSQGNNGSGNNQERERRRSEGYKSAPLSDYQVLGLNPGASLDDVNGAWRKLAGKYHPDRNPGNKQAEEMMKRVNAARDNLKKALSADSAMMGSTPGGIDLNANEKTLVEQGDKINLSLPLNPSDLQNFQTNGFIPVIINIAPPTSLPALLGLSQSNSPEQLSHL